MLTQFSFQERKRFWTIGTLVLVAISLWLLFAPDGLVRYYRLRKEVAAVHEEIAALEEQNSALAQEVERLNNDPAYLEQVAREQYGLIRKNEMVFDFSRRSKKH